MLSGEAEVLIDIIFPTFSGVLIFADSVKSLRVKPNPIFLLEKQLQKRLQSVQIATA